MKHSKPKSSKRTSIQPPLLMHMPYQARTCFARDIDITEFIDSSCIATYFHLLNLEAAVEDELIGDCFEYR